MARSRHSSPSMHGADQQASLLQSWARRLAGPDFERVRNAIAIRTNEFGYDPFGFHRDSLAVPYVLSKLLYRHYFRVDAHGIEHVPPGRVLLVANHAGQLPFDGLCISAALLLDAERPRLVRSMLERFVPTLPFVSTWFARWGQITGTPENCLRLLDSDEAILVFPEGLAGISKSITKRYQLQNFGHGFMRLALQTRTPIVPVAVIGSEEQSPSFNIAPLARLFGSPTFPLMPLPPFVPLPLPAKYRLWFGEPLLFQGDPDDDPAAIAEHVRVVRNSLETLMRMGLRERKHVFF